MSDHDPTKQGETFKCPDCDINLIWAKYDNDSAKGPSYQGYECTQCGKNYTDEELVEDGQ